MHRTIAAQHPSSHIDAKKGVLAQVRRRSTAASPAQRITLCDGNGTPLHVLTSGANVPDISRALDLLDGVAPIAGRPGRPRRRFDVLLADKGYDSDAFRRACRERGTEPIIPKRKTAEVKSLGKLRYVVEQTLALLHQFRRLAVRWERRLDIHDGFVSLACVPICWRRLINWTAQRSC